MYFQNRDFGSRSLHRLLEPAGHSRYALHATRGVMLRHEEPMQSYYNLAEIVQIEDILKDLDAENVDIFVPYSAQVRSTSRYLSLSLSLSLSFSLSLSLSFSLSLSLFLSLSLSLHVFIFIFIYIPYI